MSSVIDRDLIWWILADTTPYVELRNHFMRKFIAIWVVGLVTVVPAAIYYLLFKAETSQLPLVLFIGFWVFGFWAFFIPIYKFLRVRKMYRAISSKEDLQAFVANGETREVAIDTIIRESGMPKFLAEKAYDLVGAKVASNAESIAFKKSA